MSGPPAPPPLDEVARARGRRLAIASHPAGMTFRMVFSEHLPTLALVALGASEFQVGLQSTFVFGLIALRLPVLRAVAHFPKRSILLAGHGFALLAAAPLCLYARLGDLEPTAGTALALVCLAGVAVGLNVSETVWFPLLRAYVEPRRTGHFFGLLRTGWHLSLIVFFAFSQWWLAREPQGFGLLFSVGWALGLLRSALIARLPERSEHTGERIRIRAALALAREPQLRAYLLTVATGHAARAAVLPFAIVWMRRALGFTASDVLYTTIALFSGGLVSLYLWGRIVDRLGAVPVLRATALGQGLSIAALALLPIAGAPAPAQLVAWTFVFSVISSGFGVADTHLLFAYTPPEAPARTLVIAGVSVGVVAGTTPLVAGIFLEALLPEGSGGGDVYAAFFAILGALAAAALLPLRALARD